MSEQGWIAAGLFLIGFTIAYWWFVWRPYEQKWKRILAEMKELHRLEQEAFDEWEREVLAEFEKRNGGTNQ